MTSGVYLRPGSLIGPYRVADVADGVAEAVDPATNTRVALRSIPPEVFDRLRQSTTVRHANLTSVLAIEIFDGNPFVVREFVGGKSFAGCGRLMWREATRVVSDAARGLNALHAAGFVHGDVAPANLWRATDGVVRVQDFGLGGRPTPRYAAPEATAGLPPTPQSDVYSLGAVYCHLLTGQPPFPRATSPAEIAHAHNYEPPPAIAALVKELPLRCDSIVRRAMAKNPADRYPDMAAMLADLEAVAKSQVSSAPLPRVPKLAPRRPSWRAWRERLTNWGGTIVVLFAAVAGGYAVFGPKEPKKKDDKAAEAKVVLPTFVNSARMTLVSIPAGAFPMGDTSRGDARPHPVRLSRGFWMGVHEVTQGQYQQVTGTNPSEFPGERYPVENVSWADAVAFCEKLSGLEDELRAGRKYRLPTEAEWEYCCRAGTFDPYYGGPTLPATAANTRLSGLARTMPVGTYRANAWGLFDMHGNVAEWCADWYGIEYYSRPDYIDPTGPETGRVRVVRGGAFSATPEECRAGYRHDTFAPDFKGGAIGFRVVCVTPNGAE